MIEYEDFLEKLADSDTGLTLIRYLKAVENHYADIRNLDGVPAEVRIDALKIFRQTLLDKLLILRGEQESPDGDEWS